VSQQLGVRFKRPKTKVSSAVMPGATVTRALGVAAARAGAMSPSPLGEMKAPSKAGYLALNLAVLRWDYRIFKCNKILNDFDLRHCLIFFSA
jgi:hypothetical protein